MFFLYGAETLSDLMGKINFSVPRRKQQVHYRSSYCRLCRAREVFNSLDVDGDGSLTLKEFVTGYLR